MKERQCAIKHSRKINLSNKSWNLINNDSHKYRRQDPRDRKILIFLRYICIVFRNKRILNQTYKMCSVI